MMNDLINNDKIRIVSFSGGKDSTAMLIKLINDEIPFNEVIYVEDFFPYPKFIMEYYLSYIEKTFNIKITRLPLSYKDEVSKNKIYPSGRIKYCTRLKAEVQWRYLKEKYGRENIIFLIGTRKDESEKRNGFSQRGEWFWNKRFRVNYLYYYPIFDFTQKQVFNYIKKNKVKLNPLYNILGINRLGCSLCINSTYKQRRRFFKLFPDDFNEFVAFETEMREAHPQKDIKMFPKVSIKALEAGFINQLDLESFLPPKIEENPYLFPIIKNKMEKLLIEEKVDLFLNIIKVRMPDRFYNLPQKEKDIKLNKLFPRFLNKLSITNRQILHYITSLIIEIKKIKLIKSFKRQLIEFSQSKPVLQFLEAERKRFIREGLVPKDYFKKVLPEQEILLERTINNLRDNGFFERKGIGGDQAC